MIIINMKSLAARSQLIEVHMPYIALTLILCNIIYYLYSVFN